MYAFRNQSLNIGQQKYRSTSGEGSLTQFEGQRYIALESFRRNGKVVRTPLWFIEEGGKLYIWTLANSGKSKRIRNNPKVRVTPSSARGKPKGEWVEATARILDPRVSTYTTELIRKKYGLQFWLLTHLHGRGRIVIELEPAQ
jgi:PPOX class probable F420-dependent enzyme